MTHTSYFTSNLFVTNEEILSEANYFQTQANLSECHSYALAHLTKEDFQVSCTFENIVENCQACNFCMFSISINTTFINVDVLT